MAQRMKISFGMEEQKQYNARKQSTGGEKISFGAEEQAVYKQNKALIDARNEANKKAEEQKRNAHIRQEQNNAIAGKMVADAYNNPLSNPFGQTKAQQTGTEQMLKFAGVDTGKLKNDINAAKNAAAEPIRQSVSAERQIKQLDEEIAQKTEEAKAKKKAETRFMISGYNPDNIDYSSDDYVHSDILKREIAAKEQQRAALTQQKASLDNQIEVNKIIRNGDEKLFEKLYALDYDKDAYSRDRSWNPDAQKMLNDAFAQEEQIKKTLKDKGYDVQAAYNAYKTVTNQQEQSKRNAAFDAITRMYPTASNMVSVAAAPFKGAAGIMGFLSGETDPSSPYNVFNDLSSEVTQTTMDKIDNSIQNKYVAKTVKTLYSAGIAAAESYITMKTGGKLGELLMSMNAATQTYTEAVNRGLSGAQAFGTAFAAGVFEAAFEHISLEKLRMFEANPGKGKDFFINIVKQFFTEGSEEVSTDIANEIYDYLANGGLSNAKVAIQNYINDGKKPGEAAKAYASDFAKQLGESMIIGGLSGAMSAGLAQGGAIAMEGIADTYTGARIKKDAKSGEIDAGKLSELTGIQTKDKNGNTVVKGTAIGTGAKYSKALNETMNAYGEALQSGNAEQIGENLQKAAELSQINQRIGETKGQREIRKRREALQEQRNQMAKDHEKNLRQIAKSSDKLTTEASEKLMSLGFEATDNATGAEMPVYGLRETDDGVQAIVDLKSGATAKLDDISFSTGSKIEDQSLQDGYRVLADMITGTGAYADRGKMSAAAANECIAAYSTHPDGKLNLADFAEDFYVAYGAGLNGLSSDMFRSTTTGRQLTGSTDGSYNMTDTELKLAIEAGLRDYTPKPGVTNLTSKGTVDINTEAPILAAIDAHAKKNGYSVVLVDDAYEEKRMLNGKTNGKVILLSMKQARTFLSVTAFHEAFHYAKMQSRENAELLTTATGGLMNYILDRYGKDEYLVLFDERAPLTVSRATYTETMQGVDVKSLTAENVREVLRKAFEKETFDAIEEEIAAEWYGTAKTADLERFVDREAQKNPSLWETIKNKLREIVGDIMTKLSKLAKGNKTMANALKIAEEDRVRITEFCELVEKALGNAGNVRESEKGAGTEYKYSLAENARDDVNKVLQDVNYRQEVLLRNVTPPIILSHKNTRNLPMTMLASHVRSVVLTEDEARQLGLSVGANDHYHGLGVELFLNIIDNLDNVVEAYRGTKNAEQSERGENLFLLIAKVPSDNTEYFVPIYVNQKGNVNNAVIDVNKISSSYVKTDLRNYLQKNIRDGNIIRIKNRSTGDGDGTARLAGAYDTSASEDSISSSTEKSNSKKEKNSFALDSDGNDLTEEQAEYFKDSKVRDEDGKLLVMYHGTPNAGFTVFRSGTYFTQNKEYADVYQGRGASSLGYKKTADNPDTYAVYLNITKPFDTRNKKERDIFRREYLGKWGTGTDLMESGLPDWMDGMDLQEFLEENGYDYDGLILDEGGVGGYGEEVRSRGLSYVVFSANQVKDVANKTPTENEDIRYSYALGSEDYDKPITADDIQTLREMFPQRKSISGFTEDEVRATAKWAYKYYQQMGTKSPFFRRFFGEWRAYDITPVKYITVNNEQISPSDISRESVKNIDTDWSIRVTRDGIDETANDQNKWSKAYHAQKDIQAMLANAILFDSNVVAEPSKRMGENSAFVHIMYCPIISDGIKGFSKLYVVEEYGDTKKYYLTKIESEYLDSKGKDFPVSSSKYSDIHNIADLYALVKQYDKDFHSGKEVSPELLNADGTPKVLYHQTENDFTVFDPKHEGAGTRDNGTPFGIFMKTTPGNIGLKGSKQMKLYASMQNPLVVKNREELTEMLYSLSPAYKHIMKEISTLDSRYKQKFENAKKAFTEYLIEWRKNNPNASRSAIYEDERFDELFNAEENITEDWTREASMLDKRAKEIITSALSDNNYDGIILKEDKGSFGRVTDAYIALNSEQVKSAETGTGANIGTFSADPDIRHSYALGSEDTAELEARTEGDETLEKQLGLLRSMAGDLIKQAAANEGIKKLDKKSALPQRTKLLNIAEKALLDKQDKKAKQQIADVLTNGFFDIYTGVKESDTVVNELVQKIKEIALTTGYTEEYDTGGRELKKRMRGVRVYLDEATAGNLVSRYGSMKNVRNKAFGKFFVTTNRGTGQDISQLYEELATTEGEGNPYGLPAYESFNGDGAEMFDALLSRMKDAGTVFISAADNEGLTGETLDEWAMQRAGEVFSDTVQLAMPDGMEKIQTAKKIKEYNELSEQFEREIFRAGTAAKVAAEKRIQIYRERLSEESRKNAELQTAQTTLEYEMDVERQANRISIEEMQKKYQERLDKAYRRRMDIRAEEKAKIQIAKKVRRLNELIMHEQDNKNVPEQLKSSFADFMRMFLSPDVGVFSEERLDRMIRAYDKMQNPMGDESYINNDMYEQYDADIAKNLLDLKAVFNANGDKDWNKVRLDYITNGTAPSALAETHGFSVQSIKKRMADEDWTGAREAYLRGDSEQVKKIIEIISKTRDGHVMISTLGLDKLRRVNEILDNVAKIINEANEIRINGRKVKVANIANRAINELEKHKKNRKGRHLQGSVADMLQYKMLTPIYFFNEKLGGAFGELYEDFRNGQDDWFVKIEAAKKKLAEIKYEYKYKEWKNETATIEFSGGWTVTLTADALCQLYATIKREELAGADSEHLLFGGVVLSDELKEVQKIKDKKERQTAFWAKSHNFQFEDRLKIADAMDSISKDMKKYADAVVQYLSTDVGRWGNEASMELSGIRKFTEEYYFPFQTAENFLYRQTPTSDESKLKHQSFTNRLQYGARTPLVVSSFTEIAANHMQQMALYSSLAVPIDNFNRVYGYKNPLVSAEEGQRENNSVKAALEDSYGKGANQYISQFLKAVNGGIRADETDGLWNKATSVFKRSSVMANASVVIQQPSSIMRATAMINPVYLTGSPAFWNYAADYREMMKYCPVAGIKAMGGFDTSTGVSATEWILDEQSIGDKINNVLGKGAEFADAVAWTNIWNAVKRETRHEHKEVEVGSRQFYDICNKRMRDIVDYTQVYDSTLSKNELMRSKSGLTKMVTAFMAEPSLSYNLLTVSGKGRTINKTRALAAFVASVVLNSALKSIVGAWRDKDEELSYWEKYISTFLGNLAGSKNVLFLDSEFSVIGMIPWVKDILSIMQGYDVERSDVTVVSDLVTAATKFLQDLWDEGDKKVVLPSSDSIWGLAVAVSNLTPVPIKSIYRDITGVIANVQNARENAYEVTRLTVRNAILDEIGFGAEKAEKAYRAVLENDMETQRRMQNPEEKKINDYISKGYSPEKAVENATIDAIKSFHSLVVQGLAGYDDTVYEASDALYSGSPKEYEKMVQELKDKGFTQTDVTAAVDKVIKEKLSPQKLTDNKEYEANKPLYANEDLIVAMDGDNLSAFRHIREKLTDNGKTEADINSTMKTEIKKQFADGDITETQAKGKLQNYAGMTADEADGLLYAWNFQSKNPGSELSTDNIKKYYAELEPKGISVSTFEAFINTTKGLEADVDSDGKAISGSKREKVLAAIDKLPISSEEKDALYYYAGYKTSKIKEAPWH